MTGELTRNEIYAFTARGLAQLGSAPRSGRGGREFKSPIPDKCVVGPDGLLTLANGHRQQLVVNYVVALAPRGCKRLHHCRGRQCKHGTDRPKDRAADDRRAEGDRGMHVHRAGGDAWSDQHVLDLLIDDDERKYRDRLRR